MPNPTTNTPEAARTEAIGRAAYEAFYTATRPFTLGVTSHQVPTEWSQQSEFIRKAWIKAGLAAVRAITA